MKKVLIIIFLISCALIVIRYPLYANNIAVSNVSFSTQDTSANTLTVQFDVTWENSWRDTENYDAAWVFIKYSTDGGTTWSHATLKTSGTNPSGFSIGSGTAIDIVVPTDKKGAFIQRSSTSNGTLSTTSIKFVWDYDTDIAASTKDGDAGRAIFKVMAIEMVYIPQGSFYAGDGTSTTLEGHFESGTSGSPLQITSEDQLTLGGGGAGSLGNNNAADMTVADDFNDSTSKTLPAAFPKGYNAFYMTKYELNQGQYKDFLNTLTATQQATRCAAVTVGRFMYTDDNQTSPVGYNGIQKQSSGYVCNLDNDSTYDESTDGQWTSCNYVGPLDQLAYADWAGLRPETDLEYEKAARGTASAVVDEYVWGSTDVTCALGSVVSQGYNNETASNTGNGLAHYADTGHGPLRSGFAATASTNRVQAGAGYYGVMDLVGNGVEIIVPVGNSSGRAFTGTHGDGSLSTPGNATNTDWPGYAAGTSDVSTEIARTGWRGGAVNLNTELMRTSDRKRCAYSSGRSRWSPGTHFVRTAP